MYQTDASYGNAHSAMAIFMDVDLKIWLIGNIWEQQCLRILLTGPKDKLNEYRSEMGYLLLIIRVMDIGLPWRKVRTGLYRMYYCLVPGHYIKR